MWAKTSSLTSFKYIKFYCNNIFKLFYKDESWEMLRCTTAGYLWLWFILSQWWTDPTCEMSHTLSKRWKCMKGKRTVRNSSCCSIRFKFSQWEEFISTKRRPYLSRLPVLGDRFGLALSPEIRFQVGSLQEPLSLPPGTPGPLTERMCSYWLCWCLLTFLWEGPKPHGRRLPITSHLKNENWTKKNTNPWACNACDWKDRNDTCWQGYWETEPHMLLMRMWMMWLLWKTVWQFLQMLDIECLTKCNCMTQEFQP